MAEGWRLCTQEHRLCIATQKIWERRQLIKENLTEAQSCFGRGDRNDNTQKELIKTETRSTSSLTPMRLFTCSFYFLLGRREREIWIIGAVLSEGTQQRGPGFCHVLLTQKARHSIYQTDRLESLRPQWPPDPPAPRWQSEEPSHPHSRTCPVSLMGEDVNSLKFRFQPLSMPY